MAGYSTAAIAYFALGVLALATIVGKDGDVLGALLAVPAGGLALAILVLDEIDEAFANIYSTVVSAQNVRPWYDRRVLAVAVGAAAVGLGLVVDITAYQAFLNLIGSVFVPLFATLVVDYFLLRRCCWEVGADARPRWAMVLPWLLGFVAYQLVNPGSVTWWVAWWTALRSALGLGASTAWLSASVVSFLVAGLVTVAVGWSGRARGRAA